MDSPDKMPAQTSLFQVFLRLRPPQMLKQQNEQWLLVESATTNDQEPTQDNETPYSTHITLQPPNDSRKRAIERFGFTKIFKEEASQLDIFTESGAAESIKSLVQNTRDGLVATLGVTGSGKSHTILGTKSQRGLTQMTLDVLYSSVGPNAVQSTDVNLVSALQNCDPSEAQILGASNFLEMVYGDGDRARMSRAQTPMTGYGSRAQTPMVCQDPPELPGSFPLSPKFSPRNVKSSSTHDIQTKEDPMPNRDPESFLMADQSTPAEHDQRSVPPNTRGCRIKDRWYPPSKVPIWHRLSFKKKPANRNILKESLPSHHSRRPPVPRPSGFAQTPDVSNLSFEVDQTSEYAVLISMYEVYNDRIFDLLSNAASAHMGTTSTRQGTALQKGLTRRPLLFKNTEASPDRKVVAGLRKIVCSTYEEAMMVLETGLTERRVAGTGSNSVSSRSHGFFCIEVKKRGRDELYGSDDWNGATLAIVDLAGSERARNAKTTGSTLAEAGKINESLMYLGQCLQVQSDCQQDGSKPIVPFRQCKLTELLFSNSFPSASQPSSAYRQPQRAVMIVTADPQGDFNATSQILRYSALAREVTVPRIPSVTSAIVGGPKTPSSMPSGRMTPHDHYFSSQELEQATNEVRRLAEECEILTVRLTEEEIKRTEAELRLQATEEKLAISEQEIREDCWQEMEIMMDEEKERWRTAWEQERQMGEDYLDGKIEILEKTAQFKVHDAFEDTSRVEELERENEKLRAKLQALEQEMHTRSPTKQKKTGAATPGMKLVLNEMSNTNIATNPFLSALKPRDSGSALKLRKTAEDNIDPFEVSPRKLSLRSSVVSKDTGIGEQLDEPMTAKKKQRKLTTRKWDLGDPDEI